MRDRWRFPSGYQCIRYVVSYPRLSRITRRKGTGYLRFCRERRDVLLRAAPFLGPVPRDAATVRRRGLPAWERPAAAGRRADLVRARPEAARLLSSDVREDRCTSVKRI